MYICELIHICELLRGSWNASESEICVRRSVNNYYYYIHIYQLNIYNILY